MKFLWYLVALLGISIGLYPVLYLLVDMTQNGLLAGKGDLTSSTTYMTAFYMHIFGGGIALLAGWPQFHAGLRNRRLALHRNLGKVYLISILGAGAPAGLYIAFFADGLLTGKVGFIMLAIVWGAFTATAYAKARAKDFQEHKRWMIRSYAITFAAVTLRIWLPLFSGALGYGFQEAYPMIAWLCWVPNLFVAELIVRKNWVPG